MAQQYGPKIITDGLVLSLDAADKNSYPGSGTAWSDLSGNGKNGTLGGATFSTNVNGSLEFDGINDSLYTAAMDFSSNWTVGMWINLNSWTYDNSACGDNRTGIWEQESGYYNCIQLVSSGTSLKFNCFYANPGSFTLNFNSEYLNGWMYAVVTWDDTGYCRTWLNGTLNNSQDVSSISINPTSNLRMMYYNKHCGYAYVDGSLGIVNVWTKTLSQTEVSQNFNAQRSRFSI